MAIKDSQFRQICQVAVLSGVEGTHMSEEKKELF